MSITDELRAWWVRKFPVMDKELHKDFTAIADRIDAEHERLMRERKGCIHYDQERHYCNVHDLTTEDYKRGYDDGFASADDWLGQHESDMAEHGWVRLPVDGEAPCKQLGEWIEKRGLITGPLDHDGELWHKGDMSASPWGVIEGIVFENGKWFIRGHDMSAPWLPADSLLHYHAPTVEDVLREMADRIYADEDEPRNRDAIVAEYASKLRLAEEEDA